MGKKRKGEETNMIIIIGALVLLLITIGIWFYTAWPWIRYGALSPCWAGAVSNTDTLAGFDLIRKPQTIVLGDCISAIYFINEEDIEKKSKEIGEDFSKYLDCDSGGKSYVITVPLLPDNEYGWNIFKWPAKALENMRSSFLETFGVKAYCTILSRERSFKNPRPYKQGTYCFDIAKDKETPTYIVYYCDGKCNECGPNPHNPGLFDEVVENPNTSGWREAERLP